MNNLNISQNKITGYYSNKDKNNKPTSIKKLSVNDNHDIN
jgi:hypothetical protein